MLREESHCFATKSLPDSSIMLKSATKAAMGTAAFAIAAKPNTAGITITQLVERIFFGT